MAWRLRSAVHLAGPGHCVVKGRRVLKSTRGARLTPRLVIRPHVGRSARRGSMPALRSRRSPHPSGVDDGHCRSRARRGPNRPGRCAPIRKQGSFTAANGDQLNLSAEGKFCFGTGTATYDFQVTGGTGRFADSSGSGTWVVSPPITFNGVAGTGDEFLDGVLEK